MYMGRGKLTWKKLDGGRVEGIAGIFLFSFVDSWAFNRRFVSNALAPRVFSPGTP